MEGLGLVLDRGGKVRPELPYIFLLIPPSITATFSVLSANGLWQLCGASPFADLPPIRALIR